MRAENLYGKSSASPSVWWTTKFLWIDWDWRLMKASIYTQHTTFFYGFNRYPVRPDIENLDNFISHSPFQMNLISSSPSSTPSCCHCCWVLCMNQHNCADRFRFQISDSQIERKQTIMEIMWISVTERVKDEFHFKEERLCSLFVEIHHKWQALKCLRMECVCRIFLWVFCLLAVSEGW